MKMGVLDDYLVDADTGSSAYGIKGEVYVNATTGDDSADGTFAHPMKTLEAAQDVLAKNGTIFVMDTIVISSDYVFDGGSKGTKIKYLMGMDGKKRFFEANGNINVFFKNVTFDGNQKDATILFRFRGVSETNPINVQFSNVQMINASRRFSSIWIKCAEFANVELINTTIMENVVSTDLSNPLVSVEMGSNLILDHVKMIENQYLYTNGAVLNVQSGSLTIKNDTKISNHFCPELDNPFELSMNDVNKLILSGDTEIGHAISFRKDQKQVVFTSTPQYKLKINFKEKNYSTDFPYIVGATPDVELDPEMFDCSLDNYKFCKGINENRGALVLEKIRLHNDLEVTVMGKEYDGNPIAEPIIMKNVSGGKVTYRYTKLGNDGWSTVEAPKEVGKYEVYITSEGTEDYYSKELIEQFEITKATPEIVSMPKASNITYGQYLSESFVQGGEITTQGAFSWETPNVMPTAGKHEFKVRFTPLDLMNYVGIEFNVEVVVDKKELNVVVEATQTLYGTKLQNVNFQVTGFILGENENNAAGYRAPEIVIASQKNVKDSVPLAMEGGYADNYTFVCKDNLIRVTKMPVVPDAMITVSGKKVSNGYFVSDVEINPTPGYLISFSDEVDGDWSDGIVLSEETTGKNVAFYIRRSADGAISDAVNTTYRLDKSGPVFAEDCVTMKKKKEKRVDKFMDRLTFGSLIKEQFIVTIDAADDLSGLKSISYSTDNGNNWATVETDRSITFEIDSTMINSILYKGCDKAGNESEVQSTKDFVISTKKPEFDLTIKGEGRGSFYQGEVTVCIDMIGNSKIESITYRTNEGRATEGTVTLDENGHGEFQLSYNGSYTVRIVVEDVFGNVSERTELIRIAQVYK